MTATAVVVRVLIVDDHRMFAESLERILSDKPALSVIGIATSGEEALKRFDDGAPDVVLMDYELPDTDGVELTTRLFQKAPDVKVIMLTGMGDDDLLMRAIEAGCCGFITKDKAAEEVALAIPAAYNDEALFSPAMLARVVARMRKPDRRVGWDISPREQEVLDMLAQGLATPEIAASLFVSVHTVRTHVQAVLEKLGAHSKLEAVTIAAREGLVRLA